MTDHPEPVPSASNSSGHSNIAHGVNLSNTHVPPTPDNPHGYPPFNLCHVPTYTNNQLHHYYVSGAMLDVDKVKFMRLMEDCKAALKLINWDGNTQETTPTSHGSSMPPLLHPSSGTLSFDYNSETDSDCPKPLPGLKGIKLNPSDITQLHYDSNIAQFNNWLKDLKLVFDGDLAKYPTNCQKIIFASMTMDEQLKTTYNSTT